MKITELIEKLTSLLDKYGDNEVVIETLGDVYNINVREIYMDDASNDYVIAADNIKF